jgi:hypothetical protein
LLYLTKQYLIQNSKNNLNDQFYDRDDLHEAPHVPLQSNFQTNYGSQNDNQFTTSNTQKQTTRAQILNFPENIFPTLNKSESKNDFSIDDFLSFPEQDNFQLSEQNFSKQRSQSFDNQQKVIANDKNFGALDFHNDDINSDAENELLQKLLPISPDRPLLDDGSQLQDNVLSYKGVV